MSFAEELISELREDILPYWLDNVTLGEISFKGRIDGFGNDVKGTPLSGILVARILWTFSSASCFISEGPMRERCMEMAARAEKLLAEKFVDKEFGGSYWSINEDGSVLDSKKQYYAIAFAVYALAQMHKAGSSSALKLAIELYRSIREHSLDPEYGGYMEASTRDWQPIADMRLSAKDRNDAKTMNTHLHILEAWTGLYSAWPDEDVARSLRDAIELFLDKIVRPDGHLGLFFTREWELTDDAVSYGHDIECSWLLMEAAQVLGDESLIARVRDCCALMARAAMEGYRPGEGMYYELKDGALDKERHWWVQAEAVVGCLWQWRQSGDMQWMDAAQDLWGFIKARLLAPEGEWYWSILPDGFVNFKEDRAGFWKCPYHNGRMCMEAARILSE